MLKNGIYNTLGSVIRMGIGIISIPIQIKYLGVEEYGIWSWIMSIYAISMLAEAGMAVSTTVFVSEQLASKNENSSTSIKSIVISAMLLITVIGIVILCLLFFFSGKIAGFFYQSNSITIVNLVSSLKIIGFYVMLSMQQQVFTGVLQAYERYGLLNFLKVLQFVALHCGFLVIAYNGGNTYSLTQWAIFVMFISTIIFIFISSKIVGIKNIYIESINLEYFNKILSYSGWTWVISMGAAMFSQGDKFILGSIFPAAVIGIYAGITNITAQINIISSLPIQPLLPFLTYQMNLEYPDKEKITSHLKLSLLFNTSIALTVGIVLILFANEILSLIIPQNLEHQVVFIFRVAVIIYSVYSLNAVGYYILFSLKKLKLQSFIILSSGLFALSLIYYGAKQGGINGAIWGNIGFITTFLLTYFGVSSFIRFNIWIKWLLPFYILFGISVGIVFAYNPQSFLIKTIILIFFISSILLFTELNYNFFKSILKKQKNEY